MRLFVAVYPSEDALDHFAAVVSRLRLGVATAAGTNVRLVARPLWHVTLAFLGEVADDRAPDVAEALRAGVSRSHEARRLPVAESPKGPRGSGPGQGAPDAGAAPPKLRLAGGGRFGGRRSATLWVGLAGEVDALRSLGDAVRRELHRARVPYDRKPLRPHLTFARPGERLPAADLAADLATLRGYEGPAWTVDAVHLVRSQLGPKPVHDRIATVPLNHVVRDRDSADPA
jgi:RNA 2',3'-cyclic 3'-phosphodiesterase